MGRIQTVNLGVALRSRMTYDQINGSAVTNGLAFGNSASASSKTDQGELSEVTHAALAGVLEGSTLVCTAGGLLAQRGLDTYTYDELQRLAGTTVHP